MTDHSIPTEPRERAYRRALSIVHKNTGDPQPAAIAAPNLWLTVGHTEITREEARNAVRAGREQGHLGRVSHPEPEQSDRYFLTPAGVAELPAASMPHYGQDDLEGLRRLLEWIVADEDLGRQTVAAVNQHIISVEEGDSG